MRRFALAATVVGLLGVAQARADLLVNGDFETGSLLGWSWSPGLSDTTWETVSFDVYGGDGQSLALQVPSDPTTSGCSGVLGQSVTLTAGVPYTVSWEQGIENTGPSAILTSGEIEVRLGSQLLHRWSQGTLPGGGYTGLLESKVYVPTVSGPHELQFRFYRAEDFSGSSVSMYVDNVSVVPEPATLLMLLGAGLLWLVVWARRNRR